MGWNMWIWRYRNMERNMEIPKKRAIIERINKYTNELSSRYVAWTRSCNESFCKGKFSVARLFLYTLKILIVLVLILLHYRSIHRWQLIEENINATLCQVSVSFDSLDDLASCYHRYRSRFDDIFHRSSIFVDVWFRY